MTDESVLAGGRSTAEVLRIENTVHRSIGPNSEFAHRLLLLLEAKGYAYAPKFLGIDDKGREILTYVEGFVPGGDHVWSEAQLLKIDFDNAAPGKRVEDLAYFLWTFLKLGADIPANLQAIRMRALCAAYGYADGNALLRAVVEQQEMILAMRIGFSNHAPECEASEFSAFAAIRIRAEIEWVRNNWGELATALLPLPRGGGRGPGG